MIAYLKQFTAVKYTFSRIYICNEEFAFIHQEKTSEILLLMVNSSQGLFSFKTAVFSLPQQAL